MGYNLKNAGNRKSALGVRVELPCKKNQGACRTS